MRRRSKVERVEEVEAPQEEGFAIGQWYWLKYLEREYVSAAECTPAQWKDAKPEEENEDDEEESEEAEDTDCQQESIGDEDEEDDFERVRQPGGELYDGEDEPEPAKPPEKRYVYFEREAFACITHLGSNYALLQDRYGNDWRVLFDAMEARTRREPDPARIIDEGRANSQKRMNALMGDVKEIVRRLGIAEHQALAPATDAALARVSDATDPKRYKAELVLAKEKQLPELFKEIEAEGKELARWMTAPTIPLKAQAKAGHRALAQIEERIFSVELYAGLIEEVEKIQEGKPAAYAEQIAILQSLHYMDEECLLDYQAGGMDFGHLKDFERWLCKPKNFARLFPFSRTLVAFRVRRESKEYEFTSWRQFINFEHEGWKDANKLTFLYIRNGEQLFRLSTHVTFGERMFPNSSEQVLATQKVWVAYASHVTPKFLSDLDYQELKTKEVEEYEVELAEWKKAERQHKKDMAAWGKLHTQWKKDHAKWEVDHEAWKARGTTEDTGRGWTRWCPPENEEEPKEPKEPEKPYLKSRPWRDHKHTNYSLLDPNRTDYDDKMKTISEEVKQYNKIAMVLQGLLDRSPVLHPHPGWKIFTDAGLQAAVKLIYDQDRAITAGEAPDFEAYRTQLNKSLHAGSYTVGQDNFWMAVEAEKHNSKQNRWSDNHYDRTYYRPDGNPGPGLIAKVHGMAKSGTACRFVWKRERLRDKRDRWGDVVVEAGEDTIRCGVTVPKTALLNVSAYIPGDYKQFFEDPRTRKDYLQWAPLMLAAEDWYAKRRGSGKKTKKKGGKK